MDAEPSLPTCLPQSIIAIMKRDVIEQRRRHRLAFLDRLYDEVDGSVSTFVSAWDISSALGLSAAEAERIVEYFAEKGMIHVDDHRTGTVRLTAAGLDYIEEQRLS